jgi:hypothetical protein
LMGRYRTSLPRGASRPWRHLKQVGTVALLLLASSYLGRQQVVSRAVLLLFIPLHALTTAGAEEIYRRLRRRMERGFLALERTLLVGPRERLAMWLEQTPNPREIGVDPVGWIAGGLASEPAVEPDEPLGSGEVPWLGGWHNLPELVERFRVSQVAFWESPGRDPERRQVIGALRHRHVKLRWQGDVVWLLGAGARPEYFGGEPSGVVEPATGAVFGQLGHRFLGIIAGIILGILSLPFWLWLRLVRIPRGTARRERVDVFTQSDHNVNLTLAVDGVGMILPLPWQWPLAGALLRGDLDLWGLRSEMSAPPPTGGAGVSWWEIWRSGRHRPGLCGPWVYAEPEAAGEIPQRGIYGRVSHLLRSLWRRPGGWTRVMVTGAERPTVTDRDGEQGERR